MSSTGARQSEPRFAGAVLTGGASRRFGSDKALFRFDGVPLAEHVCRMVRLAGAQEVMAVGGDGAALAALGCFDRLLVDRWPGEGPLGGIITALEAATSEIVVVLACDTPSMGTTAPRRLVEALGDGDVAMGVVDGREQPLTAAWRRATGERLLRAFDAGERAPRRAIGALRVVRVDIDPVDVDDIDRPEDLHRYSRRAARSVGPEEHRSQG